MEAPSLSDVRATIARVLEVERGTVTAVEQSQITALRAVHGPVPMLHLDVPPGTPTLHISDGLYPEQNSGVDVVDASGITVGGMMLWVGDGRLSALEYYWFAEQPPTGLPPIDRIQPSLDIR
jgi:hypothetical protein